MLRAKIPKSFILCFSMVWIFACSPTDSQIKKEDTDSSHMRDCQNHYKSEGGLISSPIYETWMKYDQCDLKKGLDLALKTLQSQGHRIVSVDRVSGSIIAEMLLGKEKKKAYPTSIKIVEEKGSLFVHLRLEGAWGRSAPTDLCSFYDGFGMLLKRASLPQKSQPPSSSPSKSPREEKASPSPSVPVPTPPPSPSQHVAPLFPASPTPLSRGTVLWVEVNLRDGPSPNSRIIDKVSKGSPLEIYEERNGWLRVHLQNGREGWMSKKAVSENSKISSPPSDPGRPANSSKPQAPLKVRGPM